MSETKRCPQCQAEIPSKAPEGLCPPCLLQAGLTPPTGETEAKTTPFSPAGTGFVPPTPQALQPAFPQLEMLELLGKGGMGAVYKARQLHLDRLVAVKILSPDVSQDSAFIERFTREARALAKLSHPNIVAIYDFGQASGFCYFVMEFVDGVNLRQAMRAGELKPAEALKIVPQICDALQFAHDEGIIHRDIKPDNIMLDRKGRVKIADFGLAKLLGLAPNDISLTGTQQAMGTLHYMAPEQFKGSRDVDHRADIYSLGVTFYEMLTGELPIGRFAAPSTKVEIDVRLDEVVLRSLEREPEQRYQHASEIKTEIETIAREPVAAPVERTMSNGQKSSHGPRIVPLLGKLNLLFAMGLFGLGGAEFFSVTGVPIEPEWKMEGFHRQTQGEADQQTVIMRSSAALHFLGAAGLLVGGIGLLMWQRWGHRTSVGIAMLELAHCAVVLAALLDNAMNSSSTGGTADTGGSLSGGYRQMAPVIVFVALGLVYSLIQIIILIRPHILEAFRRPADQDSPGDRSKKVSPSPITPSRSKPRYGYLRRIVLPLLVMIFLWYCSCGMLLVFDVRETKMADRALIILAVGWCLVGLGYFSLKYKRVKLQSRAAKRMVLGALALVWTSLCVALYVYVWSPGHLDGYLSQHYGGGRDGGYLDQEVWPHHGTIESTVSMTPRFPVGQTPNYRRLVITEHLEFECKGRFPQKAKYSRHEFVVQIDLADGESRQLYVDALDNNSYRHRDPRSGADIQGPLLDLPVALKWMGQPEFGKADKNSQQSSAVERQAKFWVELVRSRGVRSSVFTVKLDSQARTSLQSYGDQLSGNPFFDVSGSEKASLEPDVPILYIGVPVMLIIWGGGLWLLWRRRRAAPAASASAAFSS